jgi:Uma2 family endonuclease
LAAPFFSCLPRAKVSADMNVHLPTQIDKPAFLAWLDGREERYELVDGRVVMMTRPSRAHAILVSNLIVALHRRLDPRRWTVVAEFGLDAGPKTLRFPDIVVDGAGGRGSDLTATAPVMLIEVLSPSTARFDLGDKAAEFLRIPTLSAYLVLAQDEPKAWTWVRTAERFPPGPAVIEGEQAVIHLPAFEIELSLSELYAGITFQEMPN